MLRACSPMERARRNLQLTEKQLGQVQKKRAQAAEQLQRAVVGPRPGLMRHPASLDEEGASL